MAVSTEKLVFDIGASIGKFSSQHAIVENKLKKIGLLEYKNAKKSNEHSKRAVINAKKQQEANRGVASSLGSIAARMASLAVLGLGVRAIVRTSDAVTSLKARLDLLPQATKSAADMFDVLAERANANRTSIDAYGTLFVRLSGATSDFIKDQERLLKITDSISGALIVGGATATEAASAVLQLSQAFQKGKLDGDEMRSFMENVSSDFKDKLAFQLGTTKDQFFELSRTGQLTTKKLAQAFEKMAPAIAEQLKNFPLTIGQSLTMAGNQWSLFIEKIERTGIFQKISMGVVSVMKTVGSFIDFLGRHKPFISAFFKQIGVLIGLVLIPKLITLAVAGWAAIAPFIAMAAPFALLATAIALVYDEIVVFSKGGVGLLSRFFDMWSEGSLLFKAGATAMVVAVSFLAKTIVVSAAKSALAFVSMKAKWLLTSATFVGKAVVMIKTAVVLGAKFLWLGAKMAVGWALGLAPITLIVAGITAVIAAGVALWKNWDVVTQSIGASWDMVKDKISGVYDWIVGAIEKVKEFLGFGGGGGSLNVNQTQALAAAPVSPILSTTSVSNSSVINQGSSASNQNVNVSVGAVNVSTAATDAGAIANSIKTPMANVFNKAAINFSGGAAR